MFTKYNFKYSGVRLRAIISLILSGLTIIVSSCKKEVAPSPIGHYLYQGENHQIYVSLDSFGRGTMQYKSELRDTTISMKWTLENNRLNLEPCLVSKSNRPYDGCGYGFEYSFDSSSAYIIMGDESFGKIESQQK